MRANTGYPSKAPAQTPQQPAPPSPQLSRKEFFLWLVISVVMAAGAILGAAVLAEKLDLYGNTSANDPTPVINFVPKGTGQAGYTFSEKWNVIQGPLGDVATRCDPLRAGWRMYLTANNQLTFQADDACKVG